MWNQHHVEGSEISQPPTSWSNIIHRWTIRIQRNDFRWNTKTRLSRVTMTISHSVFPLQQRHVDLTADFISCINVTKRDESKATGFAALIFQYEHTLDSAELLEILLHLVCRRVRMKSSDKHSLKSWTKLLPQSTNHVCTCERKTSTETNDNSNARNMTDTDDNSPAD